MRHIKTRLLKQTAILLALVAIPALQFAKQPNSESLEPFEKGANMKKAAYQVLHTKCNVCHQIKNPRRVFTLENMSGLAPKIYKQVFIKKRMPKGNDIQLTREEYNTLENWLLTENK